MSADAYSRIPFPQEFATGERPVRIGRIVKVCRLAFKKTSFREGHQKFMSYNTEQEMAAVASEARPHRAPLKWTQFHEKK